MSDSAKILSPEKSNPTEDWTMVLPRRGKKKRPSYTLLIAKPQEKEQPWTPMDLETDPEKQSKLMQKIQTYIQKLESSEFCNFFMDQMQNPDMLNKFLNVLGAEKKMQMVIYGIGSIELYDPPRLQLSLAILIKRKFDWIGEIEVFDPIISMTESKVLESLGCSVLSINEQGRRKALKPTLFFLPHCEADLYNNLLEANWELERLNRILIFGNSFNEYEQQVSFFKSSKMEKSRKYILAARRFTQEFGVSTFSDDSSRAFHSSSWHFFSPIDLAELQFEKF